MFVIVYQLSGRELRAPDRRLCVVIYPARIEPLPTRFMHILIFSVSSRYYDKVIL